MAKFRKKEFKKVGSFLLFFGGFLLTFGACVSVFAANYELPEPIVGQVTVTEQSGNQRFGGFTGNEAIFNYDPNVLLGFNQSGLLNCYDNGIDAVNPYCFTLDKINVIDIMNSQTSVNGMAGTETAALLWPENSIQGDVSLRGDYLNNFAFYGRNLNQNTGGLTGRGYTWGTNNYTLNREAQASYTASQQAYFDRHITLLQGEGNKINAGTLQSNPIWNLQGSSINIAATEEEEAKYPDGKVWVVGSANISGDHRYKGKGTIIFAGGNASVTLRSGASITPVSNNDFLGIITVGGSTTFEGNNDAQFASFSGSVFRIAGSNVEATGSFAAKTFDIASNLTGIRFSYDYRLDSGWPPGFRYFNMPTPKNQAP